MKWIVQLDYEFGEFEPNSIYFRRVCSDDVEYSFAYETKREALEAFCVGQVAMNELLKATEAEQKKKEGWDKAIKEAKEKYGYGKPDERIDVVRDFSPKEEKKKPVFYSKTFPPTIEERLEALENRLTEVEGMLSTI